MTTATIAALQSGYAALRTLEASQDTSSLSALTASNRELGQAVTEFKSDLAGAVEALPQGGEILAEEYWALCELARINDLNEKFVLLGVREVNMGRVSVYDPSCPIKDISAISRLKGLHKLELERCKITDISALSGMVGLQQLDISYNQITDISALSGLTGLQSLNLTDNQINDFRPLSRLNALTQLFLDGNKAGDIGPLSGLTGLTNLNISGTGISDLTALSGITRLRFLEIADNQVSELSPLSKLSSLEMLNLIGNRISSISDLAGLKSLKKLYLDRNQIRKLGAIPDGLEYLSFDFNSLGKQALSVVQKLRARGVKCEVQEELDFE